jgi:gluconokinase
MVVLLMGVAGSGKTTVGTQLAHELQWPFFDADDFHPPENVAKMRAGLALTDVDREPWLERLRALIDDLLRARRSAVLACSALRDAYRARLVGGRSREVPVVYLRGSEALLRQRLAARRGHFMKADMLPGQLATLEEPRDALVVDVAAPVDTIVERIRTGLGLVARPTGGG